MTNNSIEVGPINFMIKWYEIGLDSLDTVSNCPWSILTMTLDLCHPCKNFYVVFVHHHYSQFHFSFFLYFLFVFFFVIVTFIRFIFSFQCRTLPNPFTNSSFSHSCFFFLLHSHIYQLLLQCYKKYTNTWAHVYIIYSYT